MKYLVLVLLLLGLSTYSMGQQNDTSDIYSESLYRHLQNLKDVDAIKREIVFVELNDVTSGLPKQIDSLQILTLSRSEIKAKTKRGKAIELIVIKPVQVESSVLKVVLIDFLVTSKGRNFNYANGGGSTITFKYDCDTERFTFLESKSHGI